MKRGTPRALGSLALLVLLVSPLACGQGIITTVAGSTWVFRGDGGPATSAPLGYVYGVAIDAAGNVYASDQDNDLVVKVSPTGVLTVVAGNRLRGFSGDGGPATSASLNQPTSVAADAAGNLYVTDRGNGRIRAVSRSGTITTVAGGGSASPGDGGPATSASLAFPAGVAVDAAGNLYIAEQWGRVRKVAPPGIISTVAGRIPAYSGNGVPATSVSLSNPSGVALDAAGNLYIAEDNRIRKVSPLGIISTVAGNGTYGFGGDGGPATSASLDCYPGSLAVDAAGNLYIADARNNRIRSVSPSGIISTVAGGGSAYPGDGGPATKSALSGPVSIAVDAAGSLYIADQYNQRVRKVDPSGVISTVAGNGAYKFAGDGGPATSASLNQPWSVAADATGSLYIADQYNQRIRQVSPSGAISTVAGSGARGFSGDGGAATSAWLNCPTSAVADAAGNLYIADTYNARIRKVSPPGTIGTAAGGGPWSPPPGDSRSLYGGGGSGDGGPATSAAILEPVAVALDAAGNLYIADRVDRLIRKVDPAGIISTVAGNRKAWSPGDGGPATSAFLNQPAGVTTDTAGSLYIADTSNNRIRKVSPAGIISTVAGNGGYGFSGDGGPAGSASLANPTGIALDAAGNLYIADRYNNRIRKLSPAGIISTVAGGGPSGSLGDGGPATGASLKQPTGVAVDADGNLYIADSGNDRVRKVVPAGPPGGSGTGGQISAAGVTNGASFAAGLTPGSIVTIFGTSISRGVAGISLASGLPLPTSLGGVSVWIGRVQAPLFAVANVRGQEQINLQVPYEVSAQTTASIQVNANGVWSNTVQVPVLQAHPGIFTVDGKAGAVLHSVGNALVTASNPAAPNEVITIYATGLGPVGPAPDTGYPAPTREPLARTAATPTVTIGGASAPVLFSGLAPGFVGLYQVNAQVPGGTAPGNAVPVVIAQNGLSSNIATVAVR